MLQPLLSPKVKTELIKGATRSTHKAKFTGGLMRRAIFLPNSSIPTQRSLGQKGEMWPTEGHPVRAEVGDLASKF
jgi:hypothetical protein